MKSNPKHYVTFVRDHVQVHPASVLEIVSILTGKNTIVPGSEIPERRDVYRAGQVVYIGSVAAAKSFAKAMQGAAVVGNGKVEVES